MDKWFQHYSSDFKKDSPVDYIFRGMSDAKYKLYTSGQRAWILDNMEEWKSNYSYNEFIEDLVKEAKNKPLLKRIFDLYGYSDSERDFPILCLLQHYGAPTPLLDWSYNINCALFFAVDGVKRNFGAGNSINNYMSVYSIHKKKFTAELASLYDMSDGHSYPSISDVRNYGDENEPNANALFLLSDFETTMHGDYEGLLKVKNLKPMTSLFNQNIIPQEGLLMYNPFKDRPIEELFNITGSEEGSNLELEPFKCFNIHKDLSEYLKRLLATTKSGVKQSFIYPHFYDDAKAIKEAVFNRIVDV